MDPSFRFTAIYAHIDEIILQLIFVEKRNGTGLHKKLSSKFVRSNTGTNRPIFHIARIGTSAPFRHCFVACMFRVRKPYCSYK